MLAFGRLLDARQSYRTAFIRYGPPDMVTDAFKDSDLAAGCTEVVKRALLDTEPPLGKVGVRL